MACNSTTCGIPECQRPVYVKDNVVHDFCGRNHAQEAVSRGFLGILRPPHGTCHQCQLHGCVEEVYYDRDTDRVHDFCSRRHANMAIERGQWPLDRMQGSSVCTLPGCEDYVYCDPHTGVESEYCKRSHLEQAGRDRAAKCINPGCLRAAWVDSDTGAHLRYCGSRCAHAQHENHLCGQAQCSLPGCVEDTFINSMTESDLGYCCADHSNRAWERQLSPNTEPFVDRTFCGGTTSDTDFKLSVLTNSHPNYSSLKDQFFSKWEKPMTDLVVERIFKIQVPADILKDHEEYVAMVGNVRRRFHGTSCSNACQFFVDLRGGPCGEPSCNVCNICTHGFKIEEYNGRTAQTTNFRLRYARGLYFSSVSGKANDYAGDSEKFGPRGKKYRCMFMASVAVGKAYQTYEGSLPPHMCPPQGFDSVVAEVGQDLNFDEVAVYNEQAALPTYLIVYSFH